MKNRLLVTSGVVAVAVLGVLATVGGSSAVERLVASVGHFGLSGGSHEFTVTVTDGDTAARFSGRSGRVRFSGTSAASPDFTSNFTYVATGRFDGTRFRVALSPELHGATSHGLTFAVHGTYGTLAVRATAQELVDTRTFKAHLVFHGTVGSTHVSGTLPDHPAHGPTNTYTGTIRIG